MAGGRRALHRSLLGAAARHHNGGGGSSAGGGGGSSGGGGGAYARLLPSRGSAGHLHHPYSSGGGGGGALGGLASRWLAAPDALRRLVRVALVVLPWSALLLLVGVQSWRAHSSRPGLAQQGLPGARQCVGWRETYYCHPFA